MVYGVFKITPLKTARLFGGVVFLGLLFICFQNCGNLHDHHSNLESPLDIKCKGLPKSSHWSDVPVSSDFLKIKDYTNFVGVFQIQSQGATTTFFSTIKGDGKIYQTSCGTDWTIVQVDLDNPNDAITAGSWTLSGAFVVVIQGQDENKQRYIKEIRQYDPESSLWHTVNTDLDQFKGYEVNKILVSQTLWYMSFYVMSEASSKTFQSSDQGKTWSLIDDFPKSGSYGNQLISMLLTSRGTLLTAGSDWSENKTNFAVIRRFHGQKTEEVLRYQRSPEADHEVRNIVELQDGTLLALAQTGGAKATVFKSQDDGLTWVQLSEISFNSTFNMNSLAASRSGIFVCGYSNVEGIQNPLFFKYNVNQSQFELSDQLIESGRCDAVFSIGDDMFLAMGRNTFLRYIK